MEIHINDTLNRTKAEMTWSVLLISLIKSRIGEKNLDGFYAWAPFLHWERIFLSFIKNRFDTIGKPISFNSRSYVVLYIRSNFTSIHGKFFPSNSSHQEYRCESWENNYKSPKKCHCIKYPWDCFSNYLDTTTILKLSTTKIGNN